MTAELAPSTQGESSDEINPDLVYFFPDHNNPEEGRYVYIREDERLRLYAGKRQTPELANRKFEAQLWDKYTQTLNGHEQLPMRSRVHHWLFKLGVKDLEPTPPEFAEEFHGGSTVPELTEVPPSVAEPLLGVEPED